MYRSEGMAKGADIAINRSGGFFFLFLFTFVFIERGWAGGSRDGLVNGNVASRLRNCLAIFSRILESRIHLNFDGDPGQVEDREWG